MEHWGFKMATNYIYKYVRNNEIIYIGKTKDLKRRHQEHLRDERFLQTDMLYYFICPSTKIMDLYEIILINKYHPFLNQADNHIDIIADMIEPEWTSFLEGIKVEEAPQNILSKNEWKLLLALKLNSAPLTTLDFLRKYLKRWYKGGERYRMTQETSQKLYDKGLCNIIDRNTFSITSKGENLITYTDEEMLQMLSFTSTHSFNLYSSIQKHATISLIEFKKAYNCDAYDAKYQIIQPALKDINEVFNKEYKYKIINEAGMKFIRFYE